jgi:hypothetical protein
MVFTFAEAAEKLLGFLPAPVTPPGKLLAPCAAKPSGPAPVTTPARQAAGQPALPAPQVPATAAPALALDQAQLETLRDAFKSVSDGLHAIDQAVRRHQGTLRCGLTLPAVPYDSLVVLAQAILYGTPRVVRRPQTGQ